MNKRPPTREKRRERRLRFSRRLPPYRLTTLWCSCNSHGATEYLFIRLWRVKEAWYHMRVPRAVLQRRPLILRLKSHFAMIPSRTTLPFFQLVLRREWSSSSKAARAVSYVRKTTEKLSGQADVFSAQAHVREQREELKRWRHDVTDVAARHEDVQQKLRRVYAVKTQLYRAQRRDVASLQAINTEEEELLSEEQSLAESLDSTREGERECFEALGNAILESHERQRAQSDRMKYYSRLGSVFGAVLGFLGSTVFLRREVRKHHRIQDQKLENVEVVLRELLSTGVAREDPLADPSLDQTGISSTDSGVKKALEVNARQLEAMEDIKRTLLMVKEPHPVLLATTGLGIAVLSCFVCVSTYLLIIR